MTEHSSQGILVVDDRSLTQNSIREMEIFVLQLLGKGWALVGPRGSKRQEVRAVGIPCLELFLGKLCWLKGPGLPPESNTQIPTKGTVLKSLKRDSERPDLLICPLLVWRSHPASLPGTGGKVWGRQDGAQLSGSAQLFALVDWSDLLG